MEQTLSILSIRSIGLVEFPKFQTGIFVEWKASTKITAQRLPLYKRAKDRQERVQKHFQNI